MVTLCIPCNPGINRHRNKIETRRGKVTLSILYKQWPICNPSPTHNDQHLYHIVRFVYLRLKMLKVIRATVFFVIIKTTWKHCVDLQHPTFVPLALIYYYHGQSVPQYAALNKFNFSLIQLIDLQHSLIQCYRVKKFYKQ